MDKNDFKSFFEPDMQDIQLYLKISEVMQVAC